MVDSGDEQLSYFTQLAVFGRAGDSSMFLFSLISKWGLFSRYLQCFQSENEKVPSISHQLFHGFSSINRNQYTKKHPPQDTSELRNVFCISTYQFVFVK